MIPSEDQLTALLTSFRAMSPRCILCKGPPVTIGMYVPRDSSEFGQKPKPGKARVGLYALCATCIGNDPEAAASRAEQRLREEGQMSNVDSSPGR